MQHGITENGFKRLALSYPGNLGFEEMMRFYGEATPEQVELLENLMNYEDWEGAWTLLKEVTQTDLHDR